MAPSWPTQASCRWAHIHTVRPQLQLHCWGTLSGREDARLKRRAYLEHSRQLVRVPAPVSVSPVGGAARTTERSCVGCSRHRGRRRGPPSALPTAPKPPTRSRAARPVHPSPALTLQQPPTGQAPPPHLLRAAAEAARRRPRPRRNPCPPAPPPRPPPQSLPPGPTARRPGRLAASGTPAMHQAFRRARSSTGSRGKRWRPGPPGPLRVTASWVPGSRLGLGSGQARTWGPAGAEAGGECGLGAAAGRPGAGRSGKPAARAYARPRVGRRQYGARRLPASTGSWWSSGAGSPGWRGPGRGRGRKVPSPGKLRWWRGRGRPARARRRPRRSTPPGGAPHGDYGVTDRGAGPPVHAASPR